MIIIFNLIAVVIGAISLISYELIKNFVPLKGSIFFSLYVGFSFLVLDLLMRFCISKQIWPQEDPKGGTLFWIPISLWGLLFMGSGIFSLISNPGALAGLEGPADCDSIDAKKMITLEISGIEITLSKKDACYWDKALGKQDIAFCRKMGAGLWKRECINGVVQLKGSIEFCNEFDNLEDKAGCESGFYYSKAIESNDEKLCEQTTGADTEVCYWEIGVKKGSKEICEKMPSSSDPGSVTRCMAAATKNWGLCRELPAEQKELCMNEVARQKFQK